MPNHTTWVKTTKGNFGVFHKTDSIVLCISRVLAGKKAPSGKGYYDDNGKWVRT